jgi:hypothetical protein
MEWITSIIINLSRGFKDALDSPVGVRATDKTSIHASSPRVHAAASYRNSTVQRVCMCAIRAGQGRAGERGEVHKNQVPCFPATAFAEHASQRLPKDLTNHQRPDRKPQTSKIHVSDRVL